MTETTHLESHDYVYDIANRLSSVDSVSNTWDNNGNLLDDGTNTYTYDAANRLASVNGTTSYSYNGLGDRYQQTVSGNTTTYVLDLNTGLTQVLEDNDNAYLYGLGRIAQVNTSTDYFIGDALGSVRQLTDASGAVTLAKAYEPYGETLSTAGSGVSAFAFTGEQTDPNGLVYLRARYYGPGDGRFLSRDSWGGDEYQPITYNKWVYANANPIYYVDPTGQVAIPAWLATMLGRAIVGGAIGGAIGYGLGYGYGCFTYTWALAGECGCEMRQLALTMSEAQWRNYHATGGAVFGAIFGAIGAQGPAGLIIAGIGGLVLSGTDIHKTWQIIQNETGPTRCTITRLLIDVAIAFISYKTIKLGWKQLLATGDPLGLGTSGNSPQGLVGREFENWLVRKYGGSGSTKVDGREFDNIIGNRWMEAKSGNYWKFFNFQKFTSDTGAQLSIATKNGGKLELHSNVSIPPYVKVWLTTKDILFFEYK